MLQSFKMANYNPTKVPMAKGTKLESNMTEHKIDFTSCRPSVGKLIYLTNTILDITFSIFVISWFLAELQLPHLNAVK
jgi:hypothetical protein